VFADALAGSVLAASDNAPLLLVAPSALPDATRSELLRLKPARVMILGGAGAVSDAVAEQIADLTGATVERIKGDDRFGTATAISEVLPGKVRDADLLDGKDSSDFLAADGAAADAEALGGRPAEDYALRSQSSSLLAHLGPQPSITWDYEDNNWIGDLASLEVEIGDECGDGSTRHDLRVDVHVGHQSGGGDAPAFVSFHIEDNFQIAASFAYASAVATPSHWGTMSGPTFLEDVAPGTHVIRLNQSASGKTGTNGRSIYLQVYDFAVTDLGWTCGL
jgi:hypothetical protein